MTADPFPLASRYDRDWVEANSLGENVLHFAESLCAVLPLRPGMRVIDLGCGHAVSSIFLAREFGVTVWAVDRAIDPTANLQRIEALGCADRVFPLRADVRALPLPHGYFDVAISIDSFLYFGTDERFLPQFLRHLKADALFGVCDAYVSRENVSPQELPPAVRGPWQTDWWGVHTIDWWRNHWEKTGLLRVLCAEPLPESELIKQRYLDLFRDDPSEADAIALFEAEDNTLIGNFRLVGQRTEQPVFLEDADTDYAY